MKNWQKMMIAGALFLSLCSCSSDADREDYLLRVNDYRISREDVDALLKFEGELDSNFYVGDDTRTEFIESLIQKQLLIQEAKKQNFDQREKFRQTIQRYWESTLIRDLLAEKTQQIRKSTVVSKQEVEQYYEANREFLGDAPFAELEPELAKTVEDQKITKEIEEWIRKLREQASIDIKDKELAAKVVQ